MTTSLLPGEFTDLEPFASRWCLPTETQRWNERMASSIEDMQSFYDAILPRVAEAMKHCDSFPLNDLPEDVQRLLQLLYSFIIVSFPVELWGQPHVPSTLGAALHRISEPVP